MANSTKAVTIYGIYGSGSSEHLISFDSATPANTTGVSITGLVGTDSIYDIAFQPSTNVLFGLGGTHLYTLNLTTGAATQVGSSFTPSFGSSQVGFNFNPVTGLIDIVGNSTEVDNTMNPSTAVITPGPTLSFASGDTNAGTTVGVHGVAFSNNFAGATSTTMYDLDVAASNGVPILTTENHSNGSLTTVGSGSGTFNGNPVGFAITSSGLAFAELPTSFNPGNNQLYSVNLTNGHLMAIDVIGGGSNFLNVASIAIPVTPVPEPASLMLLGGGTTAMLIGRRPRHRVRCD